MKFDPSKTYKSGQETKFQGTVQKWLKYTFPGCFVMKIHGNQFQKTGVPDIHVTIDGLSIWIETKVGKNKPSGVQKSVIKELHQAGAVAGVCWTLQDVIDLLKDNNVKRKNRSRWQYSRQKRK